MRLATLSQAILLGIMAATMIYFVGFPRSSDLRAVWLAGQFFGDGANPLAVYTGSRDLFTMEPPRPWIDRTLTSGMEIPVYPYIYPPLWAWALSFVAGADNFGQAVLVATLANIAMLLAMPFLARRILNSTLSATGFLLILFPFYAITFPFLLGLEENQPQILVSFLLLLAIERTTNGHPLWGGVALALAASIKLYPAIFALFWLLGGERRAFASFVIVGAGLGLASIAVAGWPMHAAFLAELGAISKSALYSIASYSLDPFIAKTAFGEELVKFTTEETGGDSDWKVVAKTPVWRALNAVLFLGVLAGLSRLAWRGGLSNPFFWPLAILAIALVSPLTWVYHLIPAFTFIPALFTRYRWLPTLCLYALLVIMLRTGTFFGQFGMLVGTPGTHELVFLALLLLLGLYALVATEPADPPLHPEPQSL